MPSAAVQPGRLGRLRWLCRRGMKELDLLLETFLAAQSIALAGGRWPKFEALLQAEDDELWDWLRNPARPEARPFRELLEAIRGDSARLS